MSVSGPDLSAARSTTGMTDTMAEPISTRNLDRYGFAELPWSRPRDILASDTPEADLTFFVATVRPDGRPHSAGVGAKWVDGALYFTSGPGTLKSRNLAANPACAVSVRLRGMDLVLECGAHRVTDASTLERVAAVYRTGGWPASVEGDALTAPYSAPSAGPAPWHLYRLTLHTAVGVAGAEPHGATLDTR
jgi:Pyridoxamine 5'-phosphate oxidase